MKIEEPGHVYHLDQMDVPGGVTPADMVLRFVNREPGHEHYGTQTQEVLRALIDRTYHCHACLPSEFNAAIIHHLRMALVYHEARALVRKAEKGKYNPERVATNIDGHFALPIHVEEKSAPRPDLGRPKGPECTYRDDY